MDEQLSEASSNKALEHLEFVGAILGGLLC